MSRDLQGHALTQSKLGVGNKSHGTILLLTIYSSVYKLFCRGRMRKADERTNA